VSMISAYAQDENNFWLGGGVLAETGINGTVFSSTDGGETITTTYMSVKKQENSNAEASAVCDVSTHFSCVSFLVSLDSFVCFSPNYYLTESVMQEVRKCTWIRQSILFSVAYSSSTLVPRISSPQHVVRRCRARLRLGHGHGPAVLRSPVRLSVLD
jgi:hypothetical protein